MKNVTWVVFTDKNARVIKNPPSHIVDEFVNNPNAICSPSLDDVMGIPPHYWKLSGLRVLPMTKEEMLARDKVVGLANYGAGIDPSEPYVDERVKLLKQVSTDQFMETAANMGLLPDQIKSMVNESITYKVGMSESALGGRIDQINKQLDHYTVNLAKLTKSEAMLWKMIALIGFIFVLVFARR